MKERRSHTVCGKIWSANGSRKRILILILYTQILLDSPTGLCYSTLRRQKPSASHVSDPADPFLVRAPRLCWFSVQGVKCSCDWLETSAYCSQGITSALTLLRWSDLIASSRESEPSLLHAHFFCFVLKPTPPCLGLNRKWWCVSQSRGGMWGLSMNLATFRLVSMRQAFLLQWKNWQSCVGISNSMCHIRWGHNAVGSMRADCSAVKFISKAHLLAGRYILCIYINKIFKIKTPWNQDFAHFHTFIFIMLNCLYHTYVLSFFQHKLSCKSDLPFHQLNKLTKTAKKPKYRKNDTCAFK